MMQDEDLGGSARRNVVSQGIIRISQVNIHSLFNILYSDISLSLYIYFFCFILFKVQY